MLHRTSTIVRRANEREAGFTLIELLVVVIIIGILAAIAIPIYLGVQNNAKESSTKADLTNSKTAVVGWAVDHNGNIPTVAEYTAANLAKYGYVRSANTTTLTYNINGSATATDSTWCVDGVNTTGKTFRISSTTAFSSGTCALPGAASY